ncbi:unnamed protein product [Darwinula stevensoni]|uniref:SCP domain-containing protein n=1 Tax=Darwinula stevensoni TaxID=69355 RepID=A0A7R9FTQ0_9CRUS|nr:unnamed protein product [Darwinula stevensoni]CAG0905825.1 unnamed protein product [Darwinula stevensoni]
MKFLTALTGRGSFSSQRAGNCPSPPLLGGYIGTSNCYPSSPISSCGSVPDYGVSAAEKDQIVYYFNYLRAWVASGKETRGSPGPQPTASNMRRMVWDERLAATAQGWANNCQFGHDRNECRNYGSTFPSRKCPRFAFTPHRDFSLALPPSFLQSSGPEHGLELGDRGQGLVGDHLKLV